MNFIIVCIMPIVLQVKVNWDPQNKVLKTESYPLEGSKAKKAFVERKIAENGELLMVSECVAFNFRLCR